MSFQQPASYHVLWVAENEPLEDVYLRARILLGPTELEHDVLIPDPQPAEAFLTVVVAPRWWSARGLKAVLLATRNLNGEDFVAVYSHGVTVPHLLPAAHDPSQRRVDVYHSGSGLDDGEEVEAGTIFCVQPVGDDHPVLPSPRDIIFNQGLDFRESQLPQPVPAPAQRYAAL